MLKFLYYYQVSAFKNSIRFSLGSTPELLALINRNYRQCCIHRVIVISKLKSVLSGGKTSLGQHFWGSKSCNAVQLNIFSFQSFLFQLQRFHFYGHHSDFISKLKSVLSGGKTWVSICEEVGLATGCNRISFLPKVFLFFFCCNDFTIHFYPHHILI